MVRKLNKWEQLLDCFVKYDHLEQAVFDSDPETWTEWLYEQINDAGFKLSPRKDVAATEHAKGAKRAIHGLFSNVWQPDRVDSEVQITLTNINDGTTYDYDASPQTNVAHSVTTEEISVKVLSSKDSHYFYDLGAAGESGLIFVMKFCFEAAEIAHVNCCRQCNKFFFSKRTGAMYCGSNCKTKFNRRRK